MLTLVATSRALVIAEVDDAFNIRVLGQGTFPIAINIHNWIIHIGSRSNHLAGAFAGSWSQSIFGRLGAELPEEIISSWARNNPVRGGISGQENFIVFIPCNAECEESSSWQ